MGGGVPQGNVYLGPASNMIKEQMKKKISIFNAFVRKGEKRRFRVRET